MRTVIVYHEVKAGIPCADGIAAAWVAKQKYPETELMGMPYGQDCYGDRFFYGQDEPKYDRVIFVDFSLPLDQLEELRSFMEVNVIDHHKTAMNDLQNFSGAIFDMEESGATLTWKTFFPDRTMPAWLNYVKDRDLWNFNLPQSEEIHEAVAFMGRSMHQIDWYCSLSQEKLVELLAPIGGELLQPKRKRVAEIASTAIPCIVEGHEAMIVEVDDSESRLTSDVCSAVYKSNPEKAFVMAYSWNEAESLYALSFRSDKNGGNFDVSTIAKKFNGGGHRNASGAALPALKWIVTYDNSSGYREWDCPPQDSPQKAIEVSNGGLNGFGDPRLELVR